MQRACASALLRSFYHSNSTHHLKTTSPATRACTSAFIPSRYTYQIIQEYTEYRKSLYNYSNYSACEQNIYKLRNHLRCEYTYQIIQEYTEYRKSLYNYSNYSACEQNIYKFRNHLRCEYGIFGTITAIEGRFHS